MLIKEFCSFMLTGKQKRYLRSLAHHLDAVFQVGKGGVNDHLIRPYRGSY
jgi:RNA-binding protein YhbY